MLIYYMFVLLSKTLLFVLLSGVTYYGFLVCVARGVIVLCRLFLRLLPIFLFLIFKFNQI